MNLTKWNVRASVLVAAMFAAALAGCGLDLDPNNTDTDVGSGGGGGGGGGGGSSWVACEQLDGSVASGNAVSTFWPVGNTYGVNSFYVWEIDNASANGDMEYYFQSTGAPVTDQVPSENWTIPTTLWSAIRMNWDGLDPYHFSVEDPFYLGYLPYVNSTISWQSKTGARNDGACPASDQLVNGRQRCQGANQLDPNSPTLVAGKSYLMRMLMIIPLGAGQNRVQSCYQRIIDL